MNYDQLLRNNIQQTNASIVLALTGGGAIGVVNLLSHAGGSKNILEVNVPYSRESLNRFLGYTPTKYCGEDVARQMALKSFQKASYLSGDIYTSLGVGVNCSLKTKNQKRGEHLVYIAIQTSTTTSVASFVLDKNLGRSRFGEELIVSRQILVCIANCLSQFKSKESEFVNTLLSEKEKSTSNYTVVNMPAIWCDLITIPNNNYKAMSFNDKIVAGNILDAKYKFQKKVIFSGSFNPLHEGHLEIKTIAGKLTNREVYYEICTFPVGKPALDFQDIILRFNDIKAVDTESLIFTNATLFLDKSKLLPNSIFAIGWDTLNRINADKENIVPLIRSFGHYDCKFLVFGRSVDGKFKSVKEGGEIDNRLVEICDAVSESDFKMDISSTEIRGQTVQTKS